MALAGSNCEVKEQCVRALTSELFLSAYLLVATKRISFIFLQQLALFSIEEEK